MKRIGAGLFLTLFVVYYANATLFEHCHIINGVTIVHSHFHLESHHATPSGGHTESSLTLIAALDCIQCVDIGCVLCGVSFFSVLCACIKEVVERESVYPIIPHHFLRAPPALQ